MEERRGEEVKGKNQSPIPPLSPSLLSFCSFQIDFVKYFINRARRVPQSPLRHKITVEKIPDNQAIVRLWFKQICNQIPKWLSCSDNKCTGREIHSTTNIFP